MPFHSACSVFGTLKGRQQRRLFLTKTAISPKIIKPALPLCPSGVPALPRPHAPDDHFSTRPHAQEYRQGSILQALVRKSTSMTCIKRPHGTSTTQMRHHSSSHPRSLSRHLRTPTGFSRHDALPAGQLQQDLDQGKPGERGER